MNQVSDNSWFVDQPDAWYLCACGCPDGGTTQGDVPVGSTYDDKTGVFGCELCIPLAAL